MEKEQKIREEMFQIRLNMLLQNKLDDPDLKQQLAQARRDLVKLKKEQMEKGEMKDDKYQGK